MLLRVLHETRYRYTPGVETAQHVLMMQPLTTAAQQLRRFSLDIEPAPATRHALIDSFGNTRSFVSMQAWHDTLEVTAEAIVCTAPATALCDDAARCSASTVMPWEAVRERLRYRAGGGFDSASEFLFASPYVPRNEAFAAFARPSFTADRPLLQAAQCLMSRIHETVQFQRGCTEVGTPALDALRQGKGVCQDFAHIMVACCRQMGVPARYVSGYLLTQPPPGRPRLIGSDASHAWASVYLPGAEPSSGQWFDFDPTNDRSPGEDYVTLAIGRDFLDVSPLRGVLRGGARHVLDVAVTVEPIDDFQLTG